MQAALRSTTRRAVAISSRRGVATTSKAATASEDWLAEHEREKAWVKAMVRLEVRAQLAEEEERRITRDRLRTAAEEEKWPTTYGRWRLADDAPLLPLWCHFTLVGVEGMVVGAWLGLLLFGR